MSMLCVFICRWIARAFKEIGCGYSDFLSRTHCTQPMPLGEAAKMLDNISGIGGGGGGGGRKGNAADGLTG